MNVIGKLCQLGRMSRGYRNLHSSRIIRNAYEGSGKTTVTFISKEIGSRLLVSSSDEIGFMLNTGMKVIGPTMLFPRHAICWNVQSGRHINAASLSLITVLEPKPDLLIIGLDEQYDFAYIKSLRECVKKLGIATEIISVHNACTVFNFVNEEGRYVIAALIPRKASKQSLKPLAQRQNDESVKQIIDNPANNKTENAAKR